MHAREQTVTVTAEHEVTLRLPEHFPAGPAEVIVLATPKAGERRAKAARDLEPHPVLGGIVLNEDPALPLDPEDWPES
jgi:hypothetical protein